MQSTLFVRMVFVAMYRCCWLSLPHPSSPVGTINQKTDTWTTSSNPSQSFPVFVKST